MSKRFIDRADHSNLKINLSDKNKNGLISTKSVVISSNDYFPTEDDRLSQKQVAELFGTSVQTIINWKKKKILPYFQIGKRPIFSKKQLSLIASQNQNLLKK